MTGIENVHESDVHPKVRDGGDDNTPTDLEVDVDMVGELSGEGMEKELLVAMECEKVGTVKGGGPKSKDDTEPRNKGTVKLGHSS